MPELSRIRLKVIGHRINPDGRTVHFTAPADAPDAPAGTPAPIASFAGFPEIVVGARKGIMPDDTIIEVITKYAVVTVGTPPASEVTVSPASELA